MCYVQTILDELYTVCIFEYIYKPIFLQLNSSAPSPKLYDLTIH